MAIDDLNIYTRLCEILNIYIWGGRRIRGERGMGGFVVGERTKKEGYHKDIPLIGG